MTRNRRAGASLVEVLAASVILAVSLAALVSLLAFSFNVTQSTDEKSIAYAIGRANVERVRAQGFSQAVVVKDGAGNVTSSGRDGSETLYYNSSGVQQANSTGSVYKAVVVVTSDKHDTVSGGALRPSADSLRTVVVTVSRVSDNSVLHKDGTQLARSGI